MRAPVLALPADAEARLSIRREPSTGVALHFVCLARGGTEPIPENLNRRGEVAALLTHEQGVTWPDRDGEALAAAVLEMESGLVALVFERLGDALACMRKLEGRRHA